MGWHDAPLVTARAEEKKRELKLCFERT